MKYLSFFTFTFLLVFPLAAQEIPLSGNQHSDQLSDSIAVAARQPVVKRIILTGNTRTKDFVILREMSLIPGAPLTKQLLEYDRNRIYSLGLFNRVEIQTLEPVNSTSDSIDLRVDVVERWHIFPLPVFGIKDRDWGKVYYGFAILHNNFRGRNEKVLASLVLGYDPSVSLYYRNSFLDESGTYFLDARFALNRIRSKSLSARAVTNSDFDEKHIGTQWNVGRRFGIIHSVWVSAGYEEVRVSEYQPGRTLSTAGRDHIAVTGLGYAYDSRDFFEYPSSGALRRFTVTKFGLPGNDVDLVRYALDLRQFTPVLPRLSFGMRFQTDYVFGGKTPSYNRTYFGYSERIRGHFDEVMEGEHIMGGTAELHYEILTPKYLVVDFLPREFGVWRFGVSAALFADAGRSWFRSDSFALNRFARGYGVGLHFLLPYSKVLRVEYAWNEFRRGELIIDLGAAL